MQSAFEQKLLPHLARRNDPAHLRMRLTLRFSLLYFTMFTVAVLLCRRTLLGALPTVRSMTEAVLTDPLADCDTMREQIRAILHFARFDALVALLLAAAGMTYVTRAVNDVLLSLHATCFGCLCYGTIAVLSAGQASIPHAVLVFFVYFFSQLAMAVLLLSAAGEAVIFSYEYRDAGRTLRARRDHIAVQYILHSTAHIGTALILRGVYARLLALLMRQ